VRELVKRRIGAALAIGAILWSFRISSFAAAPAAGPLDTTYSRPRGRVVRVPAGGDFQAALDGARPGDVITLEAGATFTGPFRLPAKSGDEWIYVESSRYDDLPKPGIRVGPADAAAMARIVAPASVIKHSPALDAASGAHHYRFVGLEFTAAPMSFTYNLIELGWYESSPSELPHDIIIDRCYVHPDETKGARRGIALNGRSLAVIDSHVSGFKERGADSQAVWGYNGPGPIKIENNYLEAAGENVMFGGAAPRIPNLVPSDIEIRRNHFSKPSSWKGSDWTVKNLLEFKNASRVLVDGNVFESLWPAAQQGFAILLTPRTEGGAAPWAVVSDVTFTNNFFRDVAHGFNISGIDDDRPSQRTSRIVLRNNLLYGVDGDSANGPGMFLLVQAGVEGLRVEHNTVMQNGNILFTTGAPTSDFVYRDNLTPHNSYGVTSDAGVGRRTLDAYFPGSIFSKNVIITAEFASLYPATNYFPSSVDRVGFIDPTRRNYRLAASSPYKRAASDGTDVGADIDRLTTALAAADPKP